MTTGVIPRARSAPVSAPGGTLGFALAAAAVLLLPGCRATDPGPYSSAPAVAEAETLPGETTAGEKAAADGWPDVSEFLAKKYGFLPVPVPITEPAVGYGLAVGLAFISEPLGKKEGGFGRPDITMVGAFGTENGSKGMVAGDIRYWCEDRVQTLVGVFKAEVNLDFFGLGEGLAAGPIRYTIQPTGGIAQGKVRVGDTRLWGGLGYVFVNADVSIEARGSAPGRPSVDGTNRIAGITPSLTWDTRDNIFTPIRGAYVEANAGLFDPAFGGEERFQRPRLLAMGFAPLGKDLYLGARGQVAAGTGDVPFYLEPFIDLRGVPKFRYQGETATDFETEVRWQCWNRISLVGFGGVGSAWNGHFDREDVVNVGAGGLGVRYEIAREYGIHLGVDVAFRAGETTLYVQIGSAWARP